MNSPFFWSKTALIVASSLCDDQEQCSCVQGRKAALLQKDPHIS